MFKIMVFGGWNVWSFERCYVTCYMVLLNVCRKSNGGYTHCPSRLRIGEMCYFTIKWTVHWQVMGFTCQWIIFHNRYSKPHVNILFVNSRYCCVAKMSDPLFFPPSWLLWKGGTCTARCTLISQGKILSPSLLHLLPPFSKSVRVMTSSSRFVHPVTNCHSVFKVNG